MQKISAVFLVLISFLATNATYSAEYCQIERAEVKALFDDPEKLFQHLKTKYPECKAEELRLPGYYGTTVQRVQFIVYVEWRGGIGGSQLAECFKSRRDYLRDDIPSTFRCVIHDLN